MEQAHRQVLADLLALDDATQTLRRSLHAVIAQRETVIARYEALLAGHPWPDTQATGVSHPAQRMLVASCALERERLARDQATLAALDADCVPREFP